VAVKARPKQDRILIRELAAGASNVSAALAAGCSVRTVNRRQHDESFADAVTAARLGLVRQTVAGLSKAGTEAVTTLRELLGADSDAIRLGAARALLAHLWRGRDSHDFEDRRRMLERATTNQMAANYELQSLYDNGHAANAQHELY